MPLCDVCRDEYQQVAAYCPNCGAPLTTLAARLREASGIVTLPESEVLAIADDVAGGSTDP